MRRLLDRAVAASSNGIVITDPKVPDNPIVYVNPAFEKISGYAADEVRGCNCRFLQADDRDQSAIDELREALAEERECRVVLRNYRKDGTPFWNELYVSPVHGVGSRRSCVRAKNVSGPPSNTPPSVLRRSVSTAAGCA
jgi:PAS domain S-box-containing protein